MQQSFLGIEIGGTKLQLAAQPVTGKAGAKIIQRHRLTVDPASGADGIRRQIEATLEKMLPALKPAAVGVGFGVGTGVGTVVGVGVGVGAGSGLVLVGPLAMEPFSANEYQLVPLYCHTTELTYAISTTPEV